jgi:hypothetical protein
MGPAVMTVDNAADSLSMQEKQYHIIVLTVNLKQAGNQVDQ